MKPKQVYHVIETQQVGHHAEQVCSASFTEEAEALACARRRYALWPVRSVAVVRDPGTLIATIGGGAS